MQRQDKGKSSSRTRACESIRSLEFFLMRKEKITPRNEGEKGVGLFVPRTSIAQIKGEDDFLGGSGGGDMRRVVQDLAGVPGSFQKKDPEHEGDL